MAIRVVIADDSALMRKVISDILKTDPEIEVVAIAKDGHEAVRLTKEKSPDVLTVDLNMPGLDGLEVIKQLMREKPLPIVVISALTQEGSKATMEALNAGAIELIPKSSGEISVDLPNLTGEIIRKVKAAANAKLRKIEVKKKETKPQIFNPTRKKIIVIGASTGGPQTLEAILVQIPKNIPSPILIVQHMPKGDFINMFAQRLNGLCEIEVREAKDGDELRNGVALLAPGGYHMKLIADVEGTEGTVRLTTEPPELGVRPSVNNLFRSAAQIFRENTIGIILTGMGRDGQAGCQAIKDYNGTILAEAEESCIVYGMPKEVIDANLADEVLSLERIPVAILQIIDI